ncbi:MAG: hypothetical protein M3Z25_19110 [Actinomycetota bacterium]|nr:hypothetical protein [Actinomycetota bacterium]
MRQGRDPGWGLWSIPGGRVQPGESDHEAPRCQWSRACKRSSRTGTPYLPTGRIPDPSL